MAAMQTFSLSFSLMVMTKGKLERETLNLVWSYTIMMPTHYVLNMVCMSRITNMVTVQNFEVISDKFNTSIKYI
jgi:hypothetical protein